ncbi:hypothetical protein N665_0028s0029 [Sinapis alba]|nr:hypothetical protein N665_0028s0029 [Sinapis alba]
MIYFTTNIHTVYERKYSKNRDDYEWTPCDSRLYAISFKTSSLERITYLMLVDSICRKMVIDLLKPKRHSYILDEEDVFNYLASLDKDLRRSILNVEAISRTEKASSYGRNYSKVSNGLPKVEANPGAVSVYTAIKEEN